MARRTSIKPTQPQIKPADLRTFHRALHHWYTRHGRHGLPWRNTEDAYAIWISEVMLQQTQVATVKDRFYAPFLERFPCIEALAAAPESAVMKAWEGLGYYSRARNLHKAARHMCSAAASSRKNAPSLPDTVDELLKLSGIGRNTAHAILTFAYHMPVAILEANVKRVVARIFALPHPTDQQLWDGAGALLNQKTPFDYNQAMMDLGSLICTPKAPRCEICPAATFCAGKREPHDYPAPKAKKSVPTRHVMLTVCEDAGGKLYLEERRTKLLGGLWGFPQSASDGSEQTHCIGTVAHIYSHFRLEGTVVYTRLNTAMSGAGWLSRNDLAKHALSKLDHKVLALVEKHHTLKKNGAKTRRIKPTN